MWPGVEPVEGKYNHTYLQANKNWSERCWINSEWIFFSMFGFWPNLCVFDQLDGKSYAVSLFQCLKRWCFMSSCHVFVLISVRLNADVRWQVVRQLVDDLYGHGIWTIVDFHQVSLGIFWRWRFWIHRWSIFMGWNQHVYRFMLFLKLFLDRT